MAKMALIVWDAKTGFKIRRGTPRRRLVSKKLCRARNKAFYLRVQAGHLVAADPKAALSLLDRYFALGDDLAKAQAFADQAKAYLALGAHEEALRSLENALQRCKRSFRIPRHFAFPKFRLFDKKRSFSTATPDYNI